MKSLYQLHHARPEKISPLFAEVTDTAKRFGYEPTIVFYKDDDDRQEIWGRAVEAASRLNRHEPKYVTAMVLPNADPESLRLPVHGAKCVLIQTHDDEIYTKALTKSLFQQGAEADTLRTFDSEVQTIVADDMRGAA